MTKENKVGEGLYGVGLPMVHRERVPTLVHALRSAAKAIRSTADNSPPRAISCWKALFGPTGIFYNLPPSGKCISSE